MNELMNQIRLAAEQEPKTVSQQFLKLMEEVGESSQAYLSSQKASGSGYKQLTTANTKEELVDVLLVTLAILHKLDTSDAELENLLTTKTAKWLSKQDSNAPKEG